MKETGAEGQGDKQRWVKWVEEGKGCPAERERIGVLAATNLYFSLWK